MFGSRSLENYLSFPRRMCRATSHSFGPAYAPGFEPLTCRDMVHSATEKCIHVFNRLKVDVCYLVVVGT